MIKMGKPVWNQDYYDKNLLGCMLGPTIYFCLALEIENVLQGLVSYRVFTGHLCGQNYKTSSSNVGFGF